MRNKINSKSSYNPYIKGYCTLLSGIDNQARLVFGGLIGLFGAMILK